MTTTFGTLFAYCATTYFQLANCLPLPNMLIWQWRKLFSSLLLIWLAANLACIGIARRISASFPSHQRHSTTFSRNVPPECVP